MLFLLFFSFSFHSFLLIQIEHVGLHAEIDEIEEHQCESKRSQMLTDKCGVEPEEDQRKRELTEAHQHVGSDCHVTLLVSHLVKKEEHSQSGQPIEEWNRGIPREIVVGPDRVEQAAQGDADHRIDKGDQSQQSHS